MFICSKTTHSAKKLAGLHTMKYKYIWTNSISLSLYVSLWLYSPCGPSPLFQFLNLYTVGRTPWTGDQPVSRPLPTHRTTQTQNKRTQTSMPRVGFEPRIPLIERVKIVHASDRAATVIGSCGLITLHKFIRITVSNIQTPIN
jgi:hypothetical protein